MPRIQTKIFSLASGLLTEVVFPTDARVDSWIERGTEVSPYYDPLIAKIIVHGNDRPDALARMKRALRQTRIHGIETNLAYLESVFENEQVLQGGSTTQFLSTLRYIPATLDVLEPGTQTTIQDYPGRLGYWAVGVPPSGPMDPLAFRLGNRLLENAPTAAGLEITMSGPTLRFNTHCDFCLTGAAMKADLDGTEIEFWTVVKAGAGQTLRFGQLEGNGARAYLLVRGGLDLPDYLGSKSTFALGQIRRPRWSGTSRRRCPSTCTEDSQLTSSAGTSRDRTGGPDSTVPLPSFLPESILPNYLHEWDLGVLYGPHGAPDFFTAEDIDTFLSTEWKVHYNSNRTGIRLIGPKPKWARKDGGEAGLHPSNIHDNAYAVGAVDFTGDMPILLGPDGPSLGGFVCPAVVADAELWKLGQLKAGDTVRFRCLTVG